MSKDTFYFTALFSFAVIIGLVATESVGNYYGYPGLRPQTQYDYYRRSFPIKTLRTSKVQYQQPNTSHVSRRSQQTPPWLADLESSQPEMMQLPKPRRTHYGQTGTATLTKFFDSVGDSTGQGAKRIESSRWNQGVSSGVAGMQSLPRVAPKRVQMGVSNTMCDDAKTNLTVDWDLSPVNHTCYHPETRFPKDRTLPPIQHCDRLPPRYLPGHICMDGKIPYVDDIPTHGDHRPLWPMFGEYIFVPRERWLHNIEHGAVVMLYHPCAHPTEVNKLKNIVKGCVGKHIITPSTFLPPERPLALVAWGCRLLMAGVNEKAAVQFINTKSMRGPEGTYTKEGQYTFGLLQLATSTGNGKKYGYSKVECVNIP